MFNPYNVTTYDYYPYKPNTTDNSHYCGYNVTTTTVSDNI